MKKRARKATRKTSHRRPNPTHRRRRRNPEGSTPIANPRKRARHRRQNRRGHYVSSRKGPMRTYIVRNKHGKKRGHVRGWSAHRRPNGMSGLVTAAVAVGVGLVASVAASYVIDTALSTQSTTVQTGALVALAGATAYFVGNPAIVAGVATGLLLVPLGKMVYSAVPSLANPAAAVTPAAASAASTTPAQMQALHQMRALHQIRALHQMQALRNRALPTRSMAAVRMGGRRALAFTR